MARSTTDNDGPGREFPYYFNPRPRVETKAKNLGRWAWRERPNTHDERPHSPPSRCTATIAVALQRSALSSDTNREQSGSMAGP